MSENISGSKRFGSHKVTTIASQPKPQTTKTSTPVTTSTKTVITVQTTTPKTTPVLQRTIGARNTPIITRTASQTQSKPIVTAKPTTSQMGISSNPVQQKIQPNINQPHNTIDPFMKFGTDVLRGSVDSVKGYTTDIIDTAESLTSGKEMPQRSYRDEALTTVFTRGALEGKLDIAYSELGRRFLEEPGRVIGEVGTEVGIQVGTMGVGAVIKGAKLGATGIKTIAYSEQIAKSGIKNSNKIISPSSTSTIFGFTKNTGLNPFSKKKGTEFIAGGKGSGVAKGYTLTTRTNKKGISSTKITKNTSLTGFTKGITSKSTIFGRRFNKINNFVTPNIPTGFGSSNLVSGWLDTLGIAAIRGGDGKVNVSKKAIKEFDKGYGKIMGEPFDANRIISPPKDNLTPKEINNVEKLIMNLESSNKITTGPQNQSTKQMKRKITARRGSVYRGLMGRGAGQMKRKITASKREIVDPFPQGKGKVKPEKPVEYNQPFGPYQYPRIDMVDTYYKPPNINLIKLIGLDEFKKLDGQYNQYKSGINQFGTQPPNRSPVNKTLVAFKQNVTAKEFDARYLKYQEYNGVRNPKDPIHQINTIIPDTTYKKRITPAEREMVNGLLKEFEKKIRNDKTLQNDVETPRIVNSKDFPNTTDGEYTGNVGKKFNPIEESTSPNSIPINRAVVQKKAIEQIYLSALQGKRKKQIEEDVDKIIAWYSKAHSDKEIKKELNILGTQPPPNTGTPWFSPNINIKNGIADVSGMNSGPHSQSEIPFANVNKIIGKLGGSNDPAGVSNEYNLPSIWIKRHATFSTGDVEDLKHIKMYNAIVNAKPGSLAAKTTQEALSTLPKDINQYMYSFEFTKQQTKDMLYNKGYGGLKKYSPLVREVLQNQFILGDMSGIPETVWKDTKIKTSINAKELGLQAQIHRINEANKITNQGDPTSVLHSINYETAYKITGEPTSMLRSVDGKTLVKKTPNPFYPWEAAMKSPELKKRAVVFKTNRAAAAKEAKQLAKKRYGFSDGLLYMLNKKKITSKPKNPKPRDSVVGSENPDFGYPSWFPSDRNWKPKKD